MEITVHVMKLSLLSEVTLSKFYVFIEIGPNCCVMTHIWKPLEYSVASNIIFLVAAANLFMGLSSLLERSQDPPVHPLHQRKRLWGITRPAVLAVVVQGLQVMTVFRSLQAAHRMHGMMLMMSSSPWLTSKCHSGMYMIQHCRSDTASHHSQH